MQEHLSQRVDVEERRTDADASALLSRAEQELLGWFNTSRAEIEARIDTLTRDEITLLLEHVRQLVTRQEAKFACMLEIGSALGGTLHVDDLLTVIVQKTTELMDAERSTIFLLDRQTGELWSKIIQGTSNVEIRLQPGQGIAGWVATTGKSLNIRDAYNDPRFNAKVDEDTGYQTRNILCQPIRNPQGQIIGVIQVLNRVSGNFADGDEYLLSAIASQAAIAIENSQLYLAAVAQNMELIEIKDKLEHKVAELDMLYELERQISQSGSIEDLLGGVLRKTTRLVHASMGCVRLLGQGDQLYTLRNIGEWEDEWRFEQRRVASGMWPALTTRRDAGLLWRRCTARAGEDLVMEQAIAAREALFEESIDSAVAVALWDEDELLGSFELFNTTGGDEGGVASFLEDARKVLRLVAAQLTGSLVARRRREEEEKNSRLASIGQMLSGVLHDIKNPMAIISGYVQIMAKAEDGEARRQYAGSVLKQMDHLNEMTRELLMFARGDRNILLRKVFLHKFMEDLGEMLTAELSSRQVRLELELGYRNEAWLDQVKLKRAILNLARNAAEAMGERGGVFRIETRKEVSADGEELLVLALSDDGPGVPIEIRDRLFDSFVTQGKEHGTGLGLAIVKKVVEDHGGRITFETGTGEGTTFWIRLPLRGEQEG